jgi:segregation and condensation protein A
MPLAIAQDAITLLIDLAERGEIDPWDVKVIEVIDRFLSELSPLAASDQAAYEANLSRSGQAFLYASMLVLLKAESLVQSDAPDAEAGDGAEDEFFETGEFGPATLPPFLEQRIRRRAVAQPPQRRRVTLTELIEQLQTISAALSDQAARPRRLRRPRGHSRAQAIRSIAQLAHQENLSEMAIALEQFLTEQWAEINPAQDWLDFDLLLQLWSQAAAYRLDEAAGHSEHAAATHDRVGVFWALLLLASQSKVELEQEEFYADLKIRILGPDPMPLDGRETPGQPVSG